MAWLSVREYSALVNRNVSVVRRKCTNGMLASAFKIGNRWVIDSEEQWLDGRVKTGEYKDWRKKIKKIFNDIYYEPSISLKYKIYLLMFIIFPNLCKKE